MKVEKSYSNLWHIVLSTSICFLLLLLIGNVTLLCHVINLNKSICAEAARTAAETCAIGGNQQDIAMAVFRAINKPVINGFFIDRPELSELKFYIKNEKGNRQEMLSVKTVAGVRVPAPFLLLIASPEHNGFLHFSSCYAIKLNQPVRH